MVETNQPMSKGNPNWRKGVSANPSGIAGKAFLSLDPSLIQLKDREKQAEILRTDAYQLSLIEGRTLLRDLQRHGKKDWGEIQRRKVSWGISTDKVLGGVESAGLTLTVPAGILDKLMIAVQTKPHTNISTNPRTVILDTPSQSDESSRTTPPTRVTHTDAHS